MVTSADIARRAGVSRATVSYILNNNPNQSISEATREAVLKAARDLDYRPHAAARSLRSGRGSTVLFPLPGLQGNPVVSQLTLACQRALEAVGLGLVTDYAVYDDVDAQLDAWLKHSSAAVIDLLLPHDAPVLAALRARGVRVLSSGLPSDSSWESSSDAFGRVVRMTQLQHLIDCGARRIVTVLPTRMPTDPRVERRMIADLKGLAASQGATLTVSRARMEVTAIRKLVAGWTTAAVPDAVAAFNDDYAIAVLSASAAHGIRVPDELLVIGVDNLGIGLLTTPTLTTVAADFEDYAAAVADAVQGIISGRRKQPELPIARHRLVIRESTTRSR